MQYEHAIVSGMVIFDKVILKKRIQKTIFSVILSKSKFTCAFILILVHKNISVHAERFGKNYSSAGKYEITDMAPCIIIHAGNHF